MSAAARSSLPLTLAERLAPEASALIVVDLQNDFCAPGGYIAEVMGKDVGAAAGILAPLRTLLDAARARGVPVLWVRADYSHHRIPDSMLVKLRERGIGAECCKPGTWGADWFGLAPIRGEPVFTKHTYSGFSGTGLDAWLSTAEVRTLVFAGVQTQVCIESSVRDAHSLGFFCVVAEDAVASHTPALHEASLMNIKFLFGDVCSSARVIEAWAPDAPSIERQP